MNHAVFTDMATLYMLLISISHFGISTVNTPEMQVRLGISAPLLWPAFITMLPRSSPVESLRILIVTVLAVHVNNGPGG